MERNLNKKNIFFPLGHLQSSRDIMIKFFLNKSLKRQFKQKVQENGLEREGKRKSKNDWEEKVIDQKSENDVPNKVYREQDHFFKEGQIESQ